MIKRIYARTSRIIDSPGPKKYIERNNKNEQNVVIFFWIFGNAKGIRDNMRIKTETRRPTKKELLF